MVVNQNYLSKFFDLIRHDEHVIVRTNEFQKSDKNWNQALLLLKPELTGNESDTQALLSQICYTLTSDDIRIELVGAISGKAVRRQNVIASIYPCLSYFAHNEPWHMPLYAQKLKKHLDDIGRTKRDVVSAYPLLDRYPDLSTADLAELNDRAPSCKIGNGVYAQSIELVGHHFVTINGFFPEQAKWLSKSGSRLIGLMVSFSHTWSYFRRHIVGTINPSLAAKHSLRSRYKSWPEKSKSGTALTIAHNGFHVSPGPIEATWQLKAFFDPVISEENPMSLHFLTKAVRRSNWKIMNSTRPQNISRDLSLADLFENTEDVCTDAAIDILLTKTKR